MAPNATTTTVETTTPRGGRGDAPRTTTLTRRSRSETPRTNTNSRNNRNNRTDVVVVKSQQAKPDDVITSAIKALSSVFEDPTTLIFTLVSLAVAIDFTINPSDNFILTLSKMVGSDTAFGTFLKNNSLRAIGILMLVPATFNYNSGTSNVKYLMAIGISIAVLIFPAMTYVGYFLASLFLRVYLRTRDKTLRLIMGVALSVLVINFITKNNKAGTYSIFPDETTTSAPVVTSTSAPSTTTGRPRNG